MVSTRKCPVHIGMIPSSPAVKPPPSLSPGPDHSVLQVLVWVWGGPPVLSLLLAVVEICLGCCTS